MDEHQKSGEGAAERRYFADRARSRSKSRLAPGRFGIGVAIFLAVALAYPWYSYWVNVYLLSRELEAAGREFEKAAEESLRDVQLQNARAADVFRRNQQRQRIAGVRVKGVSDGPAGQVVIVDLGGASMIESEQTICRQAEAWLRRDLSDTTITVQRYRANAPALDAGGLVCP